MVVLIMKDVPESLRGECSRYMIEAKTNVFVGTLSTRVREHVWELVTNRSYNGSAIMVFSSPNEQGFVMQMIGEPDRRVIDIDGLQLIKSAPHMRG